MAENPNQPRDYDAVLGSQALPPVGGAVLGGLEGVKQRLAHSAPSQRIAALYEAVKYGQAGLDLVIQALGDSSEQVQWNAYSILRERAEPRVKQVLQEHIPSISALEVNCTRLGGLLAVRNWKEADRETTAILLGASGREEAGLLRLKDIERLPTQALRTINRLWLGCSSGLFGLGVQKQIWHSIGGSINADYETWYRFCDRVRWRVNESWVEYDDLTFSMDAPRGHLPFLAVGGFGVVVCLESLFSRL